ncbi:MAG: chitobiase/beta-hexosaminidase C-terminal domain-containing protein [Desulfobacter sp.]
MNHHAWTTPRIFHLSAFVLFYCLSLLFLPPALHAENATCARVKIEVKQELTLERQAFDAHMRINNGLTHAPLENIAVTVWFTDEEDNPVEASSNPDDPDASFFIRVSEMSNIDDVSGSGQVPAAASSDIHWLIIPAPGASNGLAKGKLYNVGASLTYTIGGEENQIDVSPDYIFVKPMPELTLDYFLPDQVYGDDPFTPEIEPAVPFSLGVRVKNSGSGAAQSLKIDSAQPQIKENEQGLLINFTIQGSEVNGEETPESLLVDFGTIASGTASIARWIMSCSLSGTFVDFNASYTHADELGGELTSLISDANTHTLVRDVRVDLPGRDSIRDFLSRAGDLYTVYESDSPDTAVANRSADTTLSFRENQEQESVYTLDMPLSSGFVYTRMTDPHNGTKRVKQAVRSDGKAIRPENVWLSKVQDRQTHQWDHYINLFDVNTPGAYTLVFEALTAGPQAPVLQFIPDKNTRETLQVSFIIQASDPNGTIPALSAAPLPVGAELRDNKDGTGIFDWTPAPGQKGGYDITFSASDGSLFADQRVRIMVFDRDDTDMDGMTDQWERDHFQDLARDGSGDYDHDGVTDLQEFIDQTNPVLDESAPTVPDPLYPHPNIPVTEQAPELVIENSSDTQGDAIDYAFEIYKDAGMTQQVAAQARVAQAFEIRPDTIYTWLADTGQTQVPQSQSTTSWSVPVTLDDNTRYYWRVRSSDPEGSSLWAYHDFFVNRANDPPDAFDVSWPGPDTGVDTLTPALVAMNTRDIDLDPVTYTFEIYEDDTMTVPVAASAPIAQGAGSTTAWQVPAPLNNQTVYFWRVKAGDGRGATTATPLRSFYIDTDNQAPGSPTPLSPIASGEIETPDALLTVQNASDGDGDPLEYTFEVDTTPAFDSPEKQVSPPVPEGIGTTAWQIFGLRENTSYYWRVKAGDGSAESPWAQTSFFVNQINDAPSQPTVKNPGNEAWTDTRTPVLSLHPADDPDADTLEYQFELYTTPGLTRFVYQETLASPDWTVPLSLTNNTWYFWRARALDQHGVPGPWTAVSSFFIKTDYVNAAPSIEITQPFETISTNAQTLEIRWTDNDTDSSAVIDLYYDTDDQGEDGLPITTGIPEDEEGDKDAYTWDISALDDGTYYIYAVIADEDNRVTHYAPAAITIDRTPPVPGITPQAGEYDTPFTMELFADEPAAIYYTLDGTLPGPGIGTLYETPIEISGATTVKYMAVDTTGNASDIQIAEYLFGLDRVTLELVTDSGHPIPGAKVHIVRESGSLTGMYAFTDDQGLAEFDPAAFDGSNYQFRADYLGSQFWSAPVALPDTMYTNITVPVETIRVTISAAGGPLEGYDVHLFSESGAELHQIRETDASGQVLFELPVGIAYKFRADILGNQYWITPPPIQAGSLNQFDYDAGGGRLTTTLEKDDATPISGIRLYLFGANGLYLNTYLVTDQAGQAAFDLPQGTYKIRADYLGYKFWTGLETVSEDRAVNLTLAHKDVEINVSGSYQETSSPMPAIRTYLFSAAGLYLNQYKETNAQGRVVFSLPDKAFKARANVLGHEYWSQEFTGKDTAIDIPMAQIHVSVADNGTPQPETGVYLFSGADTYLGQTLETDENGQAAFLVPEGRYRFRANHQGGHYWSPVTAFAADISHPLEISVGQGNFEFSVLKDTGQPVTNVKTHVFTPEKSYLGSYGFTDTNGMVHFDLLDGTYLFRADHLGQQHWSDPVTVPDQLSGTLTLPHQTARVILSTPNTPLADARIHLFSDTDTYLGQYQNTDSSGIAEFSLPIGLQTRFRADIFTTTQFWRDPVTIQDTGTHIIDFNTGGGLLSAILQKDDFTPLPDINMYLFTGDGRLTTQSRVTDASGAAQFQVPEADFKIRADYLGYQFWTAPAVVNSDTAVDLTLPHKDVGITLLNHYQGTSTPIPGIITHLFTAEASDLNTSQTTGQDGTATFSLPDKPYLVRADYMGQQFWTGEIQFLDTQLIISHGMLSINATQTGVPQQGLRVHLLTEQGNDLKTFRDTDANGRAEFQVPAGQAYKVVIYTGGGQVISDPAPVTTDQTTLIELDIVQ